MYECPEKCGSTTFHQTVKQRETVHVDDGGAPFYVEPHDHVAILDVECAECGAEVESDE
jgi:ribosomal protein S27AE